MRRVTPNSPFPLFIIFWLHITKRELAIRGPFMILVTGRCPTTSLYLFLKGRLYRLITHKEMYEYCGIKRRKIDEKEHYKRYLRKEVKLYNECHGSTHDGKKILKAPFFRSFEAPTTPLMPIAFIQVRRQQIKKLSSLKCAFHNKKILALASLLAGQIRSWTLIYLFVARCWIKNCWELQRVLVFQMFLSFICKDLKMTEHKCLKCGVFHGSNALIWISNIRSMLLYLCAISR